MYGAFDKSWAFLKHEVDHSKNMNLVPSETSPTGYARKPIDNSWMKGVDDDPLRGVRVWDTGEDGPTDRYTVVIPEGDTNHFVGMNDRWDHPSHGFNQYAGSTDDGYEEGSHLGSLLPEIPSHLVEGIMQRLGADVEPPEPDNRVSEGPDWRDERQ